MNIRIAKTFDFDAAHFLPGVPKDHKCARLHGHTYQAELICEGPVDPQTGMIVDYAAISICWDPLHMLLDHRLLNEIKGLENPTTEVLAPFILDFLIKSVGAVLPIVAVRVYESNTTWCEARL